MAWSSTIMTSIIGPPPYIDLGQNGERMVPLDGKPAPDGLDLTPHPRDARALANRSGPTGPVVRNGKPSKGAIGVFEG